MRGNIEGWPSSVVSGVIDWEDDLGLYIFPISLS